MIIIREDIPELQKDYNFFKDNKAFIFKNHLIFHISLKNPLTENIASINLAKIIK